MKTTYPTGIPDKTHRAHLSRRQFLTLTGITAAGFLTGHCTSKEQSPEKGKPLVLVNGTLIDGTGARAMPDAAIIVRDKQITAVGPRPNINIPDDAHVVNIQGKTLLPGFINSHVHMGFNRQNLSKWAGQGVTTVRDLGASTPYPEELFKTRHGPCNQRPRSSACIGCGCG